METRAQITLLDRIGIPTTFFWGYLGLLLFMIGDGVETSFLSRLFVDQGFDQSQVGVIFTVYGITAAIGAYLAGALSDLWGSRKVMAAGAIIWLVLHLVMLTIALPTRNYALLAASYGLRGFGYPLFAYGFMVWLIAGSPKERLNTALGWFWCCFTAGYPVIGSLLAAAFLPVLHPVGLLWLSWALVGAGAAIALLLIADRTGRQPLAAPEARDLKSILLGGITIMFTVPAVGRGAIARVINTTSQFGMWVFFPIFFTQQLGLPIEQWATLLSIMMGANMAAVIVVGMISDRWSWRKSTALFGGVFCAVACVVLYYTLLVASSNFLAIAAAAVLYGVAVAGYVALPPMMTAQAPERQGQAMSAYSLGAGASAAVGPLVGTLFIGSLGLQGVVWIYAALHLASAFLCLSIRSPGDGRP
ncbi:alpha-ketoglutarate transporter [Sphingomonas sp. Root710]|uniref:MFS transporter n=1 Tax=Sphingomonas sp. Root710 TaxID=1736594 RepID=UPI0006F4EAF6|nr:MFS transporter [Sphingomonas sp. Root710]KRB80683.1 alpha-ketoglutarate transporter [Sphingomonas sp. Root710]